MIFVCYSNIKGAREKFISSSKNFRKFSSLRRKSLIISQIVSKFKLQQILFAMDFSNFISFKCCICGRIVNGYGNNAVPVKEGICCDQCNTDVVIPARIVLLSKSQGNG